MGCWALVRLVIPFNQILDGSLLKKVAAMIYIVGIRLN
jgi:hypothetical protein